MSRLIERLVLALVFFLAPTVFHVVALFRPSVSIPESPVEHGVFAVVNVTFATLLLIPRISRWTLVLALSVLLFQQTMRHGPLIVEALAQHRLDLQSLSAVLGLVVVMVVLASERDDA